MASANIYLNFNGNCEEAFNFYKSVFGGEFTYIGRFSEMPESDDYKLPEGDKNKIMHVSLPVGSSTIMGSDVGQEWAPTYKNGNNFSISFNADSKKQADTVFTALANGGKITMPLNDTFWGDYFGMLTDKYGVNWMMSFNEKSQNK